MTDPQPESVPDGTPDETVAHLLCFLERKIHAQGWDQPAHLWTFHLDPDDPDVCGFLPVGEIPEPVDEALMEAATALRETTVPMKSGDNTMAVRTAVAVVVSREAWTHGENVDPADPRHPADTPGGREVRHLMAVETRTGNALSTLRVRGHKPQIARYSQLPPGQTWVCIASLAEVLRSVQDRLTKGGE